MKPIKFLKEHVSTTLLTCLIVFQLFSIAVPSALSATTISVINPLTENNNFTFYTNTSIGYKFNVTAWVYNVTDLFAYQVDFNIDATMLNITGAWLPSWDPLYVFIGRTTFPSPPSFFDKDVDGVIEEVWIGDLIIAGPSFTGTGKLAVIELQITAAPQKNGVMSSTLLIDTVDTYLLGPTYDYDIPTAKVNGYYEYVWLEPGLEVRPHKYVAVTELETFNISVWLNNVTTSDRLVSLKFKLRYNATLLNLTQVT